MSGIKKGTLGEQLIAAAEEAVQIELGAAKPARITKYTAAGTEVDPPHPYGSDHIKRIRAHMALSQSVFAAALNVSPERSRRGSRGSESPTAPPCDCSR